MNLKQLLASTEIAQLEDDELLMAHTELHSYWWEIEQGRSVMDWDAESLVRAHEEIRREIEARDLPHDEELNDLDHETVPEKLAQADESLNQVFTIIEEMWQATQAGEAEPMTIGFDTDTGNLRFEVESEEQAASLDRAIAIAKGEQERIGEITAPVHQVVDVEEYR